MVAAISSSTVSNWSDSLFTKLDTKKQGYVDQSDLAAALGTDEAGSTTNSDDAAAMVKQIDGDGDGKITKSELSSAISKVADELNAQFDSSRVDKSQAGAAPASAADSDTDSSDDDSSVAATASSGSSATKGAPPAGGGGGGTAPVSSASSTSSTSENKYVQAADTDSSGEVSDDEAAAYKKLMAAQAEAKQGEKPQGADSDQDLARALDMLKNYVNNSGASTQATSTITESA